jgi:glycine/D-amino acid oxidase-like deaminating enzyme
MKIVVVGAGLAGSIAATALRKSGHEVVVIDDNQPLSGSKASSNLYIAAWLKKFVSSATSEGIKFLEEMYRDQIDHPFSSGIAVAAQIKHIAQRNILVEPDVVGTVVRITDSQVTLSNGTQIDHDKLLLCCGAFIDQLVKNPHRVSPLVGHALFMEGRLPEGAAKITVPTPYKHHKLYQFDNDTIYFANSTGLAKPSFELRHAELKQKLISDAKKALGLREEDSLPRIKEYRIGYRPVGGEPNSDFGELRMLSKNIWSINCGGKNGLVAYAYRTKQFLGVLQNNGM